MIIQKLSDGSYRVKQRDAQEYYNYARVEALLEDTLTGKKHKQELNFPTQSFSSEISAKKYTEKMIQDWIKTTGNRKYNTILKLISFRRK